MAVVDELVTVLSTKLSPSALGGLQKYGKAVESVKASVLKADKALASVRQRLLPLGAMFTAGAAAGGVLVKSVVDQVSALDSLNAKLAETKKAERAKKALKEIVTKDDLKRVKAYREGVERLTLTLRGMATRIVLDALPALQGLVERGDKWLKQNKELIRDKAGHIFQGFAAGVESFYQGLLKVIRIFDPLRKKIKDLLPDMETWELVAHGVRGALFALAVIFAPLLIKFALLAAAVAAVVLIFDDLYAFLNGEPSGLGLAIDYLNQNFPELIELAGAAKKRLGEFGEILGDIAYDHVRPLLGSLKKSMNEFGEGLGDKLYDSFGGLDEIRAKLDDFYSGLGDKVFELTEKIRGWIDKLVGMANKVLGLIGVEIGGGDGGGEESEIAKLDRRSRNGEDLSKEDFEKLMAHRQEMLKKAVVPQPTSETINSYTGKIAPPPSTMDIPAARIGGGSTSIDESQTNSNNKLTDSRTFNTYITPTDPYAAATSITSQGSRDSVLLQVVPGGQGSGIS